jgi:ribosome modulation factor
MNIEHKEFVGFYHELFPAGYCQHLITEFNRLEEGGIGSNRQRGEGAHKHVKDDYQIGINLRSHNLEPFKWMERRDRV